MATAQQKLAHAREFTNIENLTLDLWLDLENNGLDERAEKVLDAGLMFEHFTSLLDSDTALRHPDEVAIQTQLGFKLSDEVRLAQQDLLDKARNRSNKVETGRWVLDPFGNWIWQTAALRTNSDTAEA